jgi:hypothetical protein
MAAGGCLSEEDELVNFYMAQAGDMVTAYDAVLLIRNMYEYFDMRIPTFYDLPVSRSLPHVTSSDVYTFILLGNGDYTELLNTL